MDYHTLNLTVGLVNSLNLTVSAQNSLPLSVTTLPLSLADQANRYRTIAMVHSTVPIHNLRPKMCLARRMTMKW